MESKLFINDIILRWELNYRNSDEICQEIVSWEVRLSEQYMDDTRLVCSVLNLSSLKFIDSLHKMHKISEYVHEL